MSDFTDYVRDVLAGADGAQHDIIIGRDDESFAYIETETNTVYLITVQLAKLEVASGA